MKPEPLFPGFTVTSPRTGTEYHVFLSVPDPISEPGPWPAVVFMDGDDQFRFAVEAYRTLRSANAVRPLLLVGLGYGASYTKTGQPALA